MSFKQQVTVAAIQMKISSDISKNLDKAEELLKRATARQAIDLVVFPEDCITGPQYHPDHVLDDTSEPIAFFRDLAKRYKLHIVCGSFIRKAGDKLFNASFLISDAGEIILRYDKNHLWITERQRLSPGNELPVVQTPLGTIGIIICWDLAFPEACRHLVQQGADIICCPAYWLVEDAGKMLQQYPDTNPETTLVDTLCAARALENEALVVFANAGGSGTATLIGHSQICAPVYGAVRKLDHNAEGVVIYTFNRQLADDAEANYQIKYDLAAGKRG